MFFGGEESENDRRGDGSREKQIETSSAEVQNSVGRFTQKTLILKEVYWKKFQVQNNLFIQTYVIAIGRVNGRTKWGGFDLEKSVGRFTEKTLILKGVKWKIFPFINNLLILTIQDDLLIWQFIKVLVFWNDLFVQKNIHSNKQTWSP